MFKVKDRDARKLLHYATRIENRINNGSNTEKSPMGMFEDYRIENDLKIVDDTICAYYEIKGDK